MRKLPESNIIPLPAPRITFARRPIASVWRGLTCVVLVRHAQTEKAILVSDSGDRTKAVWVPKALVTIDQPSDRGILVASMSKAFAEQKGLGPRFIDPAQFNEATAEALRDANARAARKRNFYRGHREPNPSHVNQNAFC